MANDIIIPPDVDPVSPENVTLVDDATQVFSPTLSRGMTQRVSFGDPRWRIKRRYSGVRAQDKARLMTIFNEARGKFCTVRTTPGYVQRGSFPSQELLANPFFSLGALNGNGQFIPTSWASESAFAFTAKDNVGRATRLAANGGAYCAISNNVTGLVQYATYAARFFLDFGPDITAYAQRTDDYGTFVVNSSAVKPLNTGIIVPRTTTARPGIAVFMAAGAGAMTGSGAYIDIPYASFARCPLVDTQVNLVTYSDAFSDASWTKARCSITSNTTAAPDSNATGDTMTEDATAGATHFVQTSGMSVPSTHEELCFTAILKANTRTWAAVTILENTGSTQANAYFNLSAGTVGTVQNNGNMIDARATITPLGLGWYRCSIVCHKTNAATSVQGQIYLAQADGLALYDGNNTSSIYVWRAGFSVSPAASVPSLTTGVASTSGLAFQSGYVNAKGFPASATGSLLAGDFIEINGELKMVTAPVHSDANGNATIQFRPAMVTPPADNDPIIVCNPMGRFLLSDISWDAQWGIQLDVNATLDEVYE